MRALGPSVGAVPHPPALLGVLFAQEAPFIYGVNLVCVYPGGENRDRGETNDRRPGELAHHGALQHSKLAIKSFGTLLAPHGGEFGFCFQVDRRVEGTYSESRADGRKHVLQER